MPDSCNVAVIWIDWYAYHVARFQGLLSNPALTGKVRGIELVGGIGVHQGLKFREELPADLPVETLMPESGWQEAGQWTLAVKVWRCLHRLNPQVVLVPGYYTLPAIAAALWARLHGRTSVLMTESTAEDHVRVWWKEQLKAALIHVLFDWAVCGGKAHVRYLHALGFPTDHIAHYYDVVDNGFLAREVAALRGDTATSHELPNGYFLYIGRLAAEKNIDGLLAAWNQYREQGGTWPLVIVGDGPESPRLRASAAASSFAGAIHFAGHKGYRELPLYYAFAGCFVLPSTREPWGLVVNEAMASGLPVVVSDRCGCAEDLVEDGRNGFVFNPTMEGTLATCLTRIGNAGEARLQDMSRRSTEIINAYSPQAFGNEVAGIV